MKVRVTLKDEKGNPVKGKASELAREGVVVVPNTEEQPEGVSWSEGEDGQYTAEYTAKTAGSNLTVTLTYTGWDRTHVESREYSITAGDVNADHSEVSVSTDTILADGLAEATVTYRARDVNDNPVTGLTKNGLTLAVTGVTGYDFSEFTESDDTPGIYTGTLTGTKAGEASLMPQING
ncbi:Ig-like domain-containing protein, partial [Methanosarcina mazei]|uniref:Ig-like domain-containing protein n=1 Tax=Methanosarcina mazei TaxID=2209 RepID=UPI001F3D35A1